MRSGFKTKKEAEKVYNQLKHNYFEGTHENQYIAILFEELKILYLENRKDKVKVSTFNAETGNIAYHILPYFKKSILQKLTRQHILAFQQYLQTKNISNNTINKIILTLKQLFDFAVEYNFISVNPAKSIKNLKVEKNQMEFWTPQEFKTFSQYIQTNEDFIYYVFFTFAYMTGARLSELLACRWQDINLHTSTWRVNVSLHYDKVSKQYYLDSPKTKASNRSITLNKKLISMIQLLKEESSSEFVFGKNSEMPRGRTFSNKFYNTIELAGVKKIRFHDLRHSHVALLIDMQEQDFIIKERMGHSSIKITYDVYGHLFPTRQRELANRLDDIL